jgi:hypothetical protein
MEAAILDTAWRLLAEKPVTIVVLLLVQQLAAGPSKGQVPQVALDTVRDYP